MLNELNNKRGIRALREAADRIDKMELTDIEKDEIFQTGLIALASKAQRLPFDQQSSRDLLQKDP